MNYSLIKKQNKGNFQFLNAKISANMIHFFGEFRLQKHLDISLHYLEYKKRSYARFLRDAPKHINTLRGHEKLLQIIENNQIIYSYCIGEYRMLPVLLNYLEYDLTILLSGKIKKEQTHVFLRLKNKLSKKVRFISSDDRNVIWKLKSSIGDNSKILVFVDGNTGISTNSKNLMKSHFLSQKVLLHKGLSYLCHLLSITPAGIVLLSDERNNFTYATFSHEASFFLEREEFCININHEIFANLSSLLTEENMAKWDTLGDVYRWLDIEQLSLENYKKGEQIFLKNQYTDYNIYRYAPFSIGKEYFMFDKKRYLTYSITKKEYFHYSSMSDKFFKKNNIYD